MGSKQDYVGVAEVIDLVDTGRHVALTALGFER